MKYLKHFENFDNKNDFKISNPQDLEDWSTVTYYDSDKVTHLAEQIAISLKNKENIKKLKILLKNSYKEIIIDSLLKFVKEN